MEDPAEFTIQDFTIIRKAVIKNPVLIEIALTEHSIVLHGGI